LIAWSEAKATSSATSGAYRIVLINKRRKNALYDSEISAPPNEKKALL
jgi:hypothetical protein